VREKVTALVLLVVLGFYSVTIGWRGVELLRDGRPVPVLLGVAVILIPVVALLAMVPLVRLARDGSAMMVQAREQGAEGVWAAELEQAEASRVAGDRAAEQRHYRAAVRAWRTSRPR
jgi:apolipoprotein N-acyltransferase